MALPRCQQQPLVSLDPILRYTVASFIADGQIVLRIGVILLGGFAIPFRRLRVVLRHAVAPIVTDSPGCIEPRRNSGRRLCDTTSPHPRHPPPRRRGSRRPVRSRRPGVLRLALDSGQRLCDTTSPPPPGPSPHLRPSCSDDRVPSRTPRRLLLPSPSLPQSVLIGLGLLRGQLNDSDTRRQQKREYQSTRFHIGKLIGFQHAYYDS